MHKDLDAVTSSKEPIGIAAQELEATIAARAGDHKKANELYRKAADREANILYTEPPAYPRPVVEGWGNVALALGDYATAEKAYREALEREPGSGRAYFGLAASLEGQGKKSDAQDARAKSGQGVGQRRRQPAANAEAAHQHRRRRPVAAELRTGELGNSELVADPSAPIVECDQLHAGLAVADLGAALDFYVNKLGFTVGFTWGGDPPTFAGVNLGNVQIFLSTGHAGGGGPPGRGVLSRRRRRCALRVPSGQRGRDRRTDRRPGYGIRDYAIRDLNGYYLSFGQHSTAPVRRSPSNAWTCRCGWRSG